jgi:hypothetical protein
MSDNLGQASGPSDVPFNRHRIKETVVSRTLSRLAWALIPILSGCSTGTVLDEYLPTEPPVVSGYPGTRPRHVASVVVWGNDERATAAAAAWVKQQGLRVVHRDRLHEALGKQIAAEEPALITEETIVLAAGTVGADAVVFADRANESRPPLVTVKGVDARTGRLLWTGDAHYDTFYGLPNTETMTLLTDQALMAAWGLQPKED